MPLTARPRLLRLLVALLATVLVVPAGQLLTAAPALAAPGAAAGAVFDSLDGPLTGVQVTAYSAPGYTSAAATAATTGDGSYTLPLAAGTYRVSFAKPGYATTWYGGGTPSDLVVDGDGQVSIDGEPVEDNLLEDVTLTSTQEHPLSGRVRNAGNESVVGAQVAAYATSDDQTPVDTAITTSAGGYTLQVPSGTYLVRYTASGYLGTFYGGTDTPEEITVQASGAVLAAGAPTGCASLCDVTLAPVPADAEWPVAGDVTDENGEPIGNVGVAVTPTGASDDSGTGTTDGDGAYSVKVRPGTYHVAFSRAGFVSRSYTGDGTVAATVTVAADGALSVSPEDPLEGNRLNPVTLQSTPFAVTGLVKAAVGGGNLGDITVRAFPSGSTTPSEIIDTDTTGPGGSYTLDLPIGVYDLQFVDNVVAAPSYVTTWLGGDPAKPLKVGQGGILTYEGATRASVPDVELSEPPADATYSVSGILADANGDGIDGLTVSADALAPTPADQSKTAQTSLVDGEHGTYELMLEPGTYRVSFAGGSHFAGTTFNGAGEEPATIEVLATGDVEVDGVEAVGGVLDTVELVGAAEHALGGTVTDSEGAGLVGITVTVYPEGETTAGSEVASVTSGAGGSYTVGGLRIGTYVVRFTDNVADGTDYLVTWLGEGPTGSPVKLGQGGVVTFAGGSATGLPNLPPATMAEPPPGATVDVSGVVEDAIGAPIDGITVQAESAGPTPEDQDTSAVTGVDSGNGEHGVYHLSLEQGTYEISFVETAAFAGATYNGTGETPVVVEVTGTGVVRIGSTEVVGGVLETVTLAGKTGYPLRGKVTNGTVALQGITVKVYAEGETTPGSEVATDTTDAAGGFDPQVKIGTYVLQFSGSAGGTAYTTRWYGTGTTGTPVQVGQAGRLYVDGAEVSALADVPMSVATAETEHPLAGTVVDANGEGLAGVTVQAEPQGGGAVADSATSTGDEGVFELGLRAGSYKISYLKAGVYAKTYYLDPEGELGTEQAVVVVASTGAMTISGVPVSAEGLEPQVLTNGTTYAVSGKVVDAATPGTGLAGIQVQAFEDGTATAVGAPVTTTSTGTYSLQLPVGTYNLRFVDVYAPAPTYPQTYFGGEAAAAIMVRTGGLFRVGDSPATMPLETLQLTAVGANAEYDLKGTVSNAADGSFEPLAGVAVSAIPVLGTPATNAASGSTGEAGTYAVPVRAGRYQLRFSKTGYQTTYLTNPDDLTRPVVVTVAANGTISAPGLEIPGGIIEDVSLQLPAPTLVTPPKLTGSVAVGQVVTTSYGTWSPNFGGAAYRDSTYVEWFLNGRPADDFALGDYGQKFKVPASAATKKLTYRITIEDPDGFRASAVYNSKAYAVPKAASTVTGVFKKGKLVVTVKVPGVPKPTGKVVVKKGRKVVGKGVLLAGKRGVVMITLKLRKGTHKLTVSYAGTATVAASKKVIKIRI